MSSPLPAGLWGLESFSILLLAATFTKDWIEISVTLTRVIDLVEKAADEQEEEVGGLEDWGLSPVIYCQR